VSATKRYSIEFARREQLSDVLGLIDQFERDVTARPCEQVLDQIYDQLTSCGGVVLLAGSDGRSVGTCTVNICANLSWGGRPYAIIENVIVAADYRQQGVGKALLEKAIEHARNAGCYKVALMTGSTKESTLRFYENAGFEQSKTGFQIRFNA